MKFDFIPAKILNSESSLKILKILLRHNIRGSERSIAKLTGLSHMSVNRAMQEFGILNLVTLKKYGTSNNWEVNIHSYAYNMLKKLMPMIDFKDAALAHLKKTLKNGLKESKIKKAVLFGSIA
jgi:DNA-binding transcriptional ArsR family regulator